MGRLLSLRLLVAFLNVRPFRLRASRALARRMVQFVSAKMPRDREVLFVVRDHSVSERKLHSIRSRVSFALARPLSADQVRVLAHPSLKDIVRSGMVVEVDEGAVPKWAHKVFRHVIAMDYERYALDGWELARISYELERDAILSRRPVVRRQFRDFVKRVTRSPKGRVYLFGTGPSLQLAASRAFSGGYVIVCNTIVRDQALWAHLRPDFIVAGDAIYHFGHTAHARSFRRDLRARLIESRGRTMFVYPELFDTVVRRELGDLSSQLAPLPFGNHDTITRSLLRHPALPAASNVLNILLLPLGCTLSRRVRLWGFDGRSPTDRLFWSNSIRHAYPELMPELIEEHPAFFSTLVPKGREDEYVRAVHGDELDGKLTAAEKEGYEFRMLHHSWTKTLDRRYDPEIGEPEGES